MRTTRLLSPAQVLLPLAICLVLCVTPRSTLRAQFTDAAVDVVADIPAWTKDAQSATGLPVALVAAADGRSSWCKNGGDLATCGNFCEQTASSKVEVVGSTNSIFASIRLDETHNCNVIFGSPSASVRVTATANGPVYRTVGVSPEPASGHAFEEKEVSVDDLFLSGPWANPFSIPFRSTQLVVWSVGGPAGSAAAPLEPFSVASGLQLFKEPAPGDAAKEGGLRYQQPLVDPNYMILGFDLAGADANPFTSFRFPDVPAGAENRFTLTLGGTEIMGLAGETVNLRQYAQNGFTALSLRGDLSPFLPAAAATDAAIPIGGPSPQLTFGLAFAQPGIGSFTLKPVPEPATIVLAGLELTLVLLAQRRVIVRTAVLRSARNSRPLARRPAF